MAGWEIVHPVRNNTVSHMAPYLWLLLEKDWARFDELTAEMGPLLERVEAGTRLGSSQILASKTCLKEINKIWLRLRQPPIS